MDGNTGLHRGYHQQEFAWRDLLVLRPRGFVACTLRLPRSQGISTDEAANCQPRNSGHGAKAISIDEFYDFIVQFCDGEHITLGRPRQHCSSEEMDRARSNGINAYRFGFRV